MGESKGERVSKSANSRPGKKECGNEDPKGLDTRSAPPSGNESVRPVREDENRGSRSAHSARVGGRECKGAKIHSAEVDSAPPSLLFFDKKKEKRCRASAEREKEAKAHIPSDTHLHEADVLGVLAEALPADVEVVLANDAPLVRAHAAAREGEEKFGGSGGGRVGKKSKRRDLNACAAYFSCVVL